MTARDRVLDARHNARMSPDGTPFQAVMPAPFGAVGIHTSADAVTGIHYLSKSAAPRAPTSALAARAVRQIERYLDDPQFRFELPLSIDGTDYQRRVWEALTRIPLGELKTYGGLAGELRSSARAVGQACGANRLPIVIPCHRVVSGAGIGGFAHHTDGYLIATKRWLLAHEGALRLA